MNHDRLSAAPGEAGGGCSDELPPLRPLWTEEEAISLERWEQVFRPGVEARWRALLGRPAFFASGFERRVEKVAQWREPEFRVIEYRQATGPGHFQKVLVLHPAENGGGALRPCAVVPFYQPETMAGLPSPSKEGVPLRGGGQPLLPFGRHLVRLGWVVACVEAYAFNTIPEESAEACLEAERSGNTTWRWPVAAAEIARRHPEWTGLGKLVHDTSLALDLLLEEPGIDRSRVLMMGHSLGGKMAFYTGALDRRVHAVIGSDFGLPWRSTNWHAPWYLGSRRPEEEEGMAHHELLALLAPRSFFLIAGETDTAEAWRYFRAAQPVARLYDAGECFAGINHASGHRPTEASLEAAYRWLCDRFGLEWRDWKKPA
ncbi:MAG TPA: hypothetical protein VNQ90_08565 [Chthoniobacteraceae bacterium]|nr:hypothetical protein [Chthoniobacteraceae bacterium]